MAIFNIKLTEATRLVSSLLNSQLLRVQTRELNPSLQMKVLLKFHAVIFKSQNMIYAALFHNNPLPVEKLELIMSVSMKSHSVLIASSLHICFLWNLFFLFLLPAPCAAFSFTMCWYFFLLFLVREEETMFYISAFVFSKLMHIHLGISPL